MKNIEEIIRKNKDSFEDLEPMDGHFDRFNWKLEKRLHSQIKRRSIIPYLLRAAVVTILVTFSSLWVWDNFIRSEKNLMALGDVSPEYREVENYYVHQVNLMEGELNNIDFSANPEQKLILENELNNMDSVYVQLQKELKINPNDERIINAMIEHYQTKVDIMNYIVGQLKAIRNENQNNQDNEKAVI